MSLKKIIHAVVYRVWFKFTYRNRRNHELTELLQYHPFIFGRMRRQR
jgi:hypothetical protein